MKGKKVVTNGEKDRSVVIVGADEISEVNMDFNKPLMLMIYRSGGA